MPRVVILTSLKTHFRPVCRSPQKQTGEGKSPSGPERRCAQPDLQPRSAYRPEGLRACVRSLSWGGATRRAVGASRNDKQERRVSRLRDACIFRLTRPFLRERPSRYCAPTHEEELAMKLRGLFIAAAVLLMPTAALAAPGIVTATVSLRAGPGEGFPTVDRIPGGARVNIHGCLRGTACCDVSSSHHLGWLSSQYLEY